MLKVNHEDRESQVLTIDREIVRQEQDIIVDLLHMHRLFRIQEAEVEIVTRDRRQEASIQMSSISLSMAKAVWAEALVEAQEEALDHMAHTASVVSVEELEAD